MCFCHQFQLHPSSSHSRVMLLVLYRSSFATTGLSASRPATSSETPETLGHWKLTEASFRHLKQLFCLALLYKFFVQMNGVEAYIPWGTCESLFVVIGSQWLSYLELSSVDLNIKSEVTLIFNADQLQWHSVFCCKSWRFILCAYKQQVMKFWGKCLVFHKVTLIAGDFGW